MRMVAFIGAVALTLVCAMLQRRPNVLYKNRIVDPQRSVSYFKLLTWSWIDLLYRHAASHGGLSATDIPQASAGLRSFELSQKWNQRNRNRSLGSSLFFQYRGKLVWIWIVTVLRSAVVALPYWAMDRALNILQNRDSSSNRNEVLGLIAVMAISELIDSVRNPLVVSETHKLMNRVYVSSGSKDGFFGFWHPPWHCP